MKRSTLFPVASILLGCGLAAAPVVGHAEDNFTPPKESTALPILSPILPEGFLRDSPYAERRKHEAEVPDRQHKTRTTLPSLNRLNPTALEQNQPHTMKTLYPIALPAAPGTAAQIMPEPIQPASEPLKIEQPFIPVQQAQPTDIPQPEKTEKIVPLIPALPEPLIEAQPAAQEPQLLPPAEATSPAKTESASEVQQPTVFSGEEPAGKMQLPPVSAQQASPEELPTAIAPAPPASELSPETRAILSELPIKIDSPAVDTKTRVTIKREDPASGLTPPSPAKPAEAIPTADATANTPAVAGPEAPATTPTEQAAAPEVSVHEDYGLSIKVSQQPYDAFYELEKAYEALLNGETEVAVEIYKGILYENPRSADALFGLASTYHRLGMRDEARYYYGELFKVAPKHREGINNFLALVAEEAPQEALIRLEALEHANPDFSPIPAQIALIHLQAGNLEAAKSAMLRATRLSPENVIYRYNLAIIFDESGNKAEARALYRELINAAQKGQALPISIEDIQERLTFISSNGR